MKSALGREKFTSLADPHVVVGPGRSGFAILNGEGEQIERARGPLVVVQLNFEVCGNRIALVPELAVYPAGRTPATKHLT